MKMLFIRRSVGQDIIDEGNFRRLLAQKSSLKLWDYNQNTATLCDDKGQIGKNQMQLPLRDTKPGDFLKYFRPDNPSVSLSTILNEYPIIVLKSCYPNSQITSEKMLRERQQEYIHLIATLSSLRQTNFVLLTSPPLSIFRTTTQSAYHARELNNWMMTQDTKNIKIFDLFAILATPNENIFANRLAIRFQRPFLFDSHPNGAGSRAAATKLADFLAETYN